MGFSDSVVISNPITCFGDLADIDVYVDNDTNTTLGGTPSFVTYQLKAFKVGAFATFSYFSSSQTSGTVVTANGLDESTYYMLLVDSVGDIPWSEANNPYKYTIPSVYSHEDEYSAAFALLDEAESYLQSSGGGTDLFYGGDAGKWIKLVNTLRMRYHLTVGNYAEALAMDNIIATEDDDLQFNYGTQELSLIHISEPTRPY